MLTIFAALALAAASAQQPTTNDMSGMNMNQMNQMDHSKMDHSKMDHLKMHESMMNHSTMHHSTMHHSKKAVRHCSKHKGKTKCHTHHKSQAQAHKYTH